MCLQCVCCIGMATEAVSPWEEPYDSDARADSQPLWFVVAKEQDKSHAGAQEAMSNTERHKDGANAARMCIVNASALADHFQRMSTVGVHLQKNGRWCLGKGSKSRSLTHIRAKKQRGWARDDLDLVRTHWRDQKLSMISSVLFSVHVSSESWGA